MGLLVDIACVCEAPSADLFDRASVHSISCALMGHCVESGLRLQVAPELEGHEMRTETQPVAPGGKG